MLLTTVFAGLVGVAAAAKDRRTFAVLRHYGRGPLTTCRADPIVSPGKPAAHVHTVMGASNFGLTVTGEQLLESSCTTSKLKGDMSSYWFPSLYFKDPETGLLEPVPMYYMNVYYFFDATNDDIKAFPLGLQMVSGNAMLRSAPSTSGDVQLDPSKGPVQPAQIVCPRQSYDPPSYPPSSNGTNAGIQSSRDRGAGIGFPFQPCDGLYSPMRVDVHMPSCYNPAAGLTDYRNNMAFPTDAGNGKLDCPKGWIHVPHMFFETYWNTQAFAERHRSLNGKGSPFVFSNGDVTGFSAHADFVSGWREDELQNIIDNCDAGHAGLHSCPGLKYGVNDDSGSCNIACPVDEKIDGKLERLPGDNPLAGWSYGAGNAPALNPAPVPLPAVPSAPANEPSPSPSSASSSSSSSSSSALDERASSTPAVVAPSPESSTSKVAAAPATTTTKAPSPQETPAAAAPSPKHSKPHRVTTVYDTVTHYATTTIYVEGSAPTSIASPGAAAAATTTPGKDKHADIGEFQYVGCFRDSHARVLSGETHANLKGKPVTNEACVAHCLSRGFTIAGTEWTSECFCGNVLSPAEKLDDKECSMKCQGDDKTTCGGDWALTVYAKGGKLGRRHAAAHAHKFVGARHHHHARHASGRLRR
ncbi:hypothetical protein VTJ83DRAFT_944 [Remersonia thermophila]|uniref:WSC domain-containing protein n=1 Tax=Remersonia thermophila TaxID=72144 RepID=A0ABR4DMK0_9PEZI